MPPPLDAVLLVSSGGPTPGCCRGRDPCPGEAVCFVSGALGGESARSAEIAARYRQLGGFSPFNRHTEIQAEVLEAMLRLRGHALGVFCAYRHWAPSVKDVVAGLARSGRRSLLAVILAPHPLAGSWDGYLTALEEARSALGHSAPGIAVLDPWWDHPSFITASAARVAEALRTWERPRAAKAELVFTGPAAPARTPSYETQFAQTAAAVADRLGRPFTLAYQGGTGTDLVEYLSANARSGRDFVVSPIGFLVDGIEILYDLDVTARKAAESRGSGFLRAAAVGTHIEFIGMLATRIAARSGG